MAKGPCVALFMGKIVAGCSLKAIDKGNNFTCHWHFPVTHSSSMCNNNNYAISEQCMKAEGKVMECCYFVAH